MELKKLNTKEQEIVDEVKQREDIVYIITQLNNFHNFKQFMDEDGIDLEKVLPHLCKDAIDRGERIETKGYLDLMPIIQELS